MFDIRTVTFVNTFNTYKTNVFAEQETVLGGYGSPVQDRVSLIQTHSHLLSSAFKFRAGGRKHIIGTQVAGVSFVVVIDPLSKVVQRPLAAFCGILWHFVVRHICKPLFRNGSKVFSRQ